MNGPYMKSAVPARHYILDPYFAVLLTNVESVGPAQILHVLVVFRTGEADPVFFVTAEVPREADQAGTARPKAGIPTLCTFAEDGLHSHLETSPAWRDLGTFADRALEIVRERFGLEEEASAPE